MEITRTGIPGAPATRLLRLRIVRLPSRRIDSQIAGALWLEDNDRSSEGESWCRRALGLQQESVGSDDLITAMILGTLGEVLADLGRHDEAEECYRRFVEIRENLDGPFHLEVVVTLEKLASLCEAKGEFEEADLFVSAGRGSVGADRRSSLECPADRRGAHAQFLVYLVPT